MKQLSVIFLAISAVIFLSAAVPSAIAKNTVGVIVVDIQGDFTTYKNGSLAVAGTDKAFIEKVLKATESLSAKGYPVFATQDWHPEDHVSFFSNHEGKKPFEAIQIEDKTQVLWPPHCIQKTANAELLLDPKISKVVVKKGKDKRYDSYSGFQDDGGTVTEMNQELKKKGVKEVIVYGIATDYCVKATALDALDAGYKVTVIAGLSKGVAPDTTAQALAEMESKGVTILKELEI